MSILIKFLLFVGFGFAFILLPQVRYTCFHIPQVAYNAVRDLYHYVKYKKYNEFKAYGRILTFIADEKQPFGSGKTLNMVRYVKNVYKEYNGKLIWSKDKQAFVPQVIKVYSNIKLKGIPYIPLVCTEQIIKASEVQDDSIVKIMVIDEMGTQWNNREWKTNLSSDMIQSLLQQRKSKLLFLGTVQDFSLFDALIRKVCSSVYTCTKKWRFLVLKEYYAKDLERAQNNPELIKVRSTACNFAYDCLYNSYDTNERVAKIVADVQAGKMLTNEEILVASNGQSVDMDSLTNIKRKYRKRVRK